MRAIRIFSMPSHATKERTSGVDFVRIIQPSKHLNGYEDDEVRFETTIYDPVKDEKMNWQEVAENHDIIFFNYTAMPWEFAKMGLFARKYNRLLVMDCDDDIWDIQPDNPVHIAFKKGSENLANFTAICREVDYMTTTSKYLRNVIAKYTDKSTSKIKVFPNYIDLSLYSHRSEFKNTNSIKILHFGSTTHFSDLQSKEFEQGVDRIMKEYPNVTFKTVGALIPAYKYKWGHRYENGYGDQDLYKWVRERFPMFMDETDILVTPLEDNIYTKCKSYIKFLEGSSAVKAGVWQKIRQYEEIVDGTNGFTAFYADEWYEAIKKLIEDPKLRKEMGEKAFETAQKNEIKDHVSEYASFFKGLTS